MRFPLTYKAGLALSLGLAVAACGDAQDPQLEVSSIESGARGDSSARAANFRIYRQSRGFLVELYNDPAEALFETLSDSGLDVRRSGRDQLVIGTRVGCLRGRQETFCQMLANSVDDNVEGYDVAVQGKRFRSTASELFGLAAAAERKDARRINEISSGLMDCAKSGNDVWCGFKGEVDTTEPEPQEGTPAQFAIRLVGMDDLGADAVYEGWFITSNGPVTSGRFDLQKDDQTLVFETTEEIAADTSTFVLTIEPARGDDPAPAATHILAGDFRNGIAQLRLEHQAALGTNFSSASGEFILGAPSAPGTPDRFGIWFVNPSNGTPSLDLPRLPDGWVYEGWIVGDNGPVSTGRFTNVRGADSDGAGPTAGPEAGPAFPGQDFINPPMDLVGTTVVISVEPEPDNSPAPFTMKPVIGTVDSAAGHVLMPMSNKAADSTPLGVCAFFDSTGNIIR